MKLLLKILGAILAMCVLAVGALVWYAHDRSYVPSDAKAEAFFREHNAELDHIISVVESESSLDFVTADWESGPHDQIDPAHVKCAELLRKIGAQFLRHSDGAIEIYFWGTGCAICHDSYKGFAYILPEARYLKYAHIVSSLEDAALQKENSKGIQDGSYIRRLDGHWFIVRWEGG